MRTLRVAMIGAISLVLAVTAAPTAANAAAGPPYKALQLSTPYGIRQMDSSNSHFQMQPDPSHQELSVYTEFTNQGSTGIFVDAWPPLGAAFEAGVTYQLGHRDATHATMYVGSSGGCSLTTGTLTILELGSWSAANTPTAYAASFSYSGSNCPNGVNGEVRFNSTVPYKALTPSQKELSFQGVPVGTDGTPQTVTLAPSGGAAVEVGTVTVAGANPSAFAVTGDTCSGTTVAADGSCTITVTPHPTGVDYFNASLEIATDAASGKSVVGLSVQGNDPHALMTFSPSVAFDNQLIGTTAAAKTITVHSYGSQGTTLGTAVLGGAAPGLFTIVTDACSGQTLALHDMCDITVTATTNLAGWQYATLQLPNNSLENPLTVQLSIKGIAGASGTYHRLSPQRILDTREGNGSPKAPIGPGGVVHLQVAGRGGVPASGVSAVVLNVTVTGPTAGGYLTVFPTGVARPTASSLNFPKGWTGANSVTVGLGTDGMVDIFNLAGSTQVIADVMGYYVADDTIATGGEFYPVIPLRIFDTREDWKGIQLPAQESVQMALNFGTAGSHIRAWAVNITAVAPGSSGFLTAWNGLDGQRPGTSTLNFAAGKVVPNMAIVPVAPCDFDPGCAGMPMIGIYNGSNSGVHVLVDIVGFYDDGTIGDGLRFQPRTPVRITDTRTGLGTTTLGTNSTKSVTTPAAIAGENTVALAMNVTAVAPTKGTYLALWPAGVDGLDRPGVSNLNPAAQQTVANAAVTLIGPTNAFNIYNFNGTTNVLVDVVGTFVQIPSVPTAAGTGFAASGPTIRARPVTIGETFLSRP